MSILNSHNRDGNSESQLHMDCHDVHLVEGLRTVGTLSHAVGNTVFNAVVAECMAAGFECCVFEILSAYGAKCKSLAGSVSGHQ